MENYFISDGSQQHGPFSFEELKSKNLKKDTLVWKEGMSGWTAAGEINELKEILAKVPPPLSSAIPPLPKINEQIPEESPRRKTNSFAWILGIAIVGVVGFLIWKGQQNSHDENSSGYDRSQYQSSTYEKTPEEIKAELGEKENDYPQKYLTVIDGTFRKNLIGETVIEGTIKNKATIAVFKDIVIKAEFLAPSGTSLGSEKFTRYETLGPGYDVTFKFKTYAPKEAKNVSIIVINATPIR